MAKLRLCGTRTPGAVYVTAQKYIDLLDDFDQQVGVVQDMLVCPPVKLWDESPAEIGISAIGVHALERINTDGTPSGIWDIYDWIGESNYSVGTFLMEGAAIGFSRKISQNLLGKVTPGVSMYFAVAKSLMLLREPCQDPCSDNHVYDEAYVYCLRQYMRDFHAKKTLPTYAEIPAIFLRWTIDSFDLVMDPLENTHQSAADLLDNLGLPYQLEEE